MEADKSQELQSGSWGPRRAIGVSSSPKAGKLENQEEPMFQFRSQGRKIWKAIRQEELVPFLLRGVLAYLVSSTDWMRPTHVREGSLLYSVC